MMNPPEQTGLRWVKASRSQSLGACLEFAANGEMISVRDSKDPGVHLHFTRQEVMAFIDGARQGEFDHLAGQ
jgi:hypothetical protein